MNSHQPTRLPAAHLHGELALYSAPHSLTTHINWALVQMLENTSHLLNLSDLPWRAQSQRAGTSSIRIEWKSSKSVVGDLAKSLLGWHYLYFEIREFDLVKNEGTLIRSTPNLGMHCANIGSTGDIMIHENYLQTLLVPDLKELGENSDETVKRFRKKVSQMLGIEWDKELEPLRCSDSMMAQSQEMRVSI